MTDLAKYYCLKYYKTSPMKLLYKFHRTCITAALAAWFVCYLNSLVALVLPSAYLVTTMFTPSKGLALATPAKL